MAPNVTHVDDQVPKSHSTEEHQNTLFMFFCGHEPSESTHKCDPGGHMQLSGVRGQQEEQRD